MWVIPLVTNSGGHLRGGGEATGHKSPPGGWEASPTASKGRWGRGRSPRRGPETGIRGSRCGLDAPEALRTPPQRPPSRPSPCQSPPLPPITSRLSLPPPAACGSSANHSTPRLSEPPALVPPLPPHWLPLPGAVAEAESGGGARWRRPGRRLWRSESTPRGSRG